MIVLLLLMLGLDPVDIIEMDKSGIHMDKSGHTVYYHSKSCRVHFYYYINHAN